MLSAAAGMNGMLGKPVALHELLDVVAQHVWAHWPDRTPAQLDAVAVRSAPALILSAARLKDLRATLSADTLSSLIEDCLVDLTERLDSLREALRLEAMEQVIAHAHAIAGMAAEYGMAALETRVRVLMHLAHEDFASAAAMVKELEIEVLRGGAALREATHSEMV
jgi:hypothetical protein